MTKNNSQKYRNRHEDVTKLSGVSRHVYGKRIVQSNQGSAQINTCYRNSRRASIFGKGPLDQKLSMRTGNTILEECLQMARRLQLGYSPKSLKQVPEANEY